MDKVKKFLEANVQWLAVALGAVFFGWMIYTYVLQKPVSSSVGGNPASPGDVDRLIWEGPGEKLENEVKSQTVPPGIGSTVNYPAQIIAELTKPSGEPGVLPVPFTPIPAPLAQGSDVVVPIANGAAKIQTLPVAPPLVHLLVSGGHSNVPATLAPGNAGGAAPPGAPQAVDRNWRTVSATFPTVALAKAFKDVGIAPGTPLSNTSILRVVLMRQERNVDGSSWPDDSVFTEIQPLDINPLDPVPPLLAPFDVQTTYLDYATKSFTEIARPPFYQVMQGDVWYEPGTPNPNDAKTVVENNFDPAHPENYTGDENMLLPSEKTAVDEAKRQQAIKEKLQNNRSNNPVSRPPGNFSPIPGSGPGGYPPPSGGRPGAGVVEDPGRIADNFGNPMMPPFGGYNPNPGFGAPPMPGVPAANSVAPPSGSFDPSQQAEFKVWVHDPTVQAGKTYRYKMKYIISNPVARTMNLCPPALSNQFYIESAPSAWTDPVNVESDTNFFAVGLKRGIEFNVFKWKNGIWQMQDVTASPGDMVGSVVTDAATGVSTNFATGWTLVDIREDPSDNSNRLLVLVSDNGTVLKKELGIDAHSPEYRKLWQQYNLNKPAPGVAGGAPGNPNP